MPPLARITEISNFKDAALNTGEVGEAYYDLTICLN